MLGGRSSKAVTGDMSPIDSFCIHDGQRFSGQIGWGVWATAMIGLRGIPRIDHDRTVTTEVRRGRRHPHRRVGGRAGKKQDRIALALNLVRYAQGIVMDLRHTGDIKGVRLLAVAVLTVLLLCIAAPASAKGYEFSSVDIVAEIDRDGNMTVSENRTFDFDGDFTFAFIDLPTNPGWEYTDIQIWENDERFRPATPKDLEPVKTPGTFFVEDQSSQLRTTWYYRALDEERTFRITYKVMRAVDSYDDVAELYWKFLGDGWDVGTRSLRYRVILPDPGARFPELQIFQHGPLNGQIRSTSATEIVGTTSDVPAETFVEARMLFPKQLVPGAEKQSGTRLAAAKAEEERFAREADQNRWVARGLLALTALLPVLGMAMFSYLYLRYGKEYRPDVGEYYREFPTDLPPAVVGYTGTGSPIATTSPPHSSISPGEVTSRSPKPKKECSESERFTYLSACPAARVRIRSTYSKPI